MALSPLPPRFPSDYAPRAFDPAEALPGRRHLDEQGRVRFDGVEYAMNEGWRPLVLDLMLPPAAAEGAAVPVVVHVHGGAWRGGSHQPRFDDLIDPVPVWELLRSRGIAVASITYRHSAEALFPAQLHDVAAAIRWLRAIGPAAGLDPERIGVLGESAGGHLAALVAQPTPARLAGDRGVTGVASAVAAAVAWYPVTDFTGDSTLADPVNELLGGTTRERPDAAHDASVTSWVSPASPPLLLIHGDSDGLVPLEQSELLHAAYQRSGAVSELVVVPGADHCFLGVDPQPLFERTADFLAEHLGV